MMSGLFCGRELREQKTKAECSLHGCHESSGGSKEKFGLASLIIRDAGRRMTWRLHLSQIGFIEAETTENKSRLSI